VIFNVPVGSITPVSQTVVATNSGGGSLGEITCPASPAAWIACDVQGTDVIVTVLPGGFVSSPSPVVFEVQAAGAPDDPAQLTVQLNIQHTMALSSDELDFTWEVGTAAPPTQTIDVTNTTGTQAQLGAIGCSAPSPRFTCTVNQTTERVTVRLNPTTPSTLTVANSPYTFTIEITAANAGNSPQAVTVTVTVTP
jgi:hypothetical protein